MTDAKRDNNGEPVLLGTSNADGVTPLMLQLDPSTHGIQIDDNTTGSDLSTNTAKRDRNQLPVGMAVSKNDGTTKVPIYIDSSTNKLLINSN